MGNNEPILKTENELIRQGKDINWPELWAVLDKEFLKDKILYAKFQNYVPPHKNTALLFIMAYRKAMEDA